MEDVLKTKGGVTHTKMLVLSRTGHHAKAANKVAKGQSESVLLLEARAALAACSTSRCPPAVDPDEPELAGNEAPATGEEEYEEEEEGEEMELGE